MAQTRKNVEEGMVTERPPRIRGLSVSVGMTLILVVLAARAVLTGEAGFVSQPALASERLTWAPPQLNNPLILRPTNDRATFWNDPNNKKDCLVEMPDYPLRRGLNIYNCHHVVIIGGEIDIPWQGDNPDIPSRRMLIVQDATGIVHIEGLWGHGEDISEGIVGFSRESIIQIQNVRIDHIRARDQVNFTDNHPDLIQSWGNAKEIRVDRLTGSSDYQGFMLKADDGYPHGPVTIKNTNIIGDPTARYQFWIGSPDQGDITLENFWMDVPPQRWGGLCNSVWPYCGASYPFKSIISQDEQGRDYATFPGDMTPHVTGRITEGRPPEGDSVPEGVAGISYVSPGYGSSPPAPTPTTPPPLPSPTPEPSFVDVPPNHPYFAEIEALYQAGYTAGCSAEPLMYCPEQTMNRAESAVFVERGIHSATFAPAVPSAQVFADLPLDSWAAAWVHSLWQDQYTAGCGTNPLIYCPWQGHTRAEGCVFYLRMLKGYDFTPPPVSSPVFADVPLDAWYAGWIHAAYGAGLLPACQTSPDVRFCPDGPLTRALAAYMMVQAKGLR